ncbi:AAA family ATPase [Campylobacter sp. faydin G-24]|uniref:AAA family ATPase n=1 Tax=Campylobacter anatolicus TaxID=2829105 RepID=A0ABS5HGC6_9BACT|nr:AAA family ATPase [Campylobacter anatolicus]MBR8463331.1 AAA family ATPase [Campylobacter anatolicus]
MQKVIIKNLGAIKECEIELSPFTIFIGESGVGKSIILRTVSLLKWIYKKMQYKALLKASKINSDALRFRLDGLLKNSMLDDFFTKDSYIELLVDGVSVVVIENAKLTPKYNNIKKKTFLVGKIVFLNDIRSSLPEILSSPSGKRAKFSYYTNDMIENFNASFSNAKHHDLFTMDISLTSKKRVGYEQFYIKNKDSEIKFENSSSGEKNITILELICGHFASKYDFADGFSKGLLGLITERVELKNLEQLQNFMKKNDFNNFLDIFIEEPEVNLYPMAQKKLVYFLSSLRKMTNTPSVVFSTHSPYILTALNNLLYASLLQKRGISEDKIYKIVDEKFILNIDEFNAYLVADGGVKSIIDSETNLIRADEIDKVSSIIMDDFDALLELR